MEIKDAIITFSGEREFNELMESFIVPELKKRGTFTDVYLLPHVWSIDDGNQKLTDAYCFYVDTNFEQFPALIFKDHNRWLVCKAERFYKSDKLNHGFIPPRDRKRDYAYLEINNRYVFFPSCNSHSLLDLYENNPFYIESLLEDKLGEFAYFTLKFFAQGELLKIRHYKRTSKAIKSPYDPLKEALRFIVNNKNLIPSPDLNGVYLFNDLEFCNIEDLISYLAKEIHLKNLAYKMKTGGLTQYDFTTTLSPEDISTILKDINKGDNGNENTKEEVNAAE